MKTGYVRVSTEEQATGGASLDTQKAAIVEAYQNIEIVEEIGSGCAIDTRPALSALLQRVAIGEITGIVVYKLDRLSRDMGDTLSIARDCRLISIAESVDTGGPTGQLQMQVLALVAQQERNNIIHRVRVGVAAARGTAAITEEEVNDWRRDRLRGMTYRAIADKYKRCYATVRRNLKSVKSGRDGRIKQMSAAGMQKVEIAQQLGISSRTVYNVLSAS